MNGLVITGECIVKFYPVADIFIFFAASWSLASSSKSLLSGVSSDGMSKSPGAFNRSLIIWLLVRTLSVTGNGPPSFDAAESLISKEMLMWKE